MTKYGCFCFWTYPEIESSESAPLTLQFNTDGKNRLRLSLLGPIPVSNREFVLSLLRRWCPICLFIRSVSAALVADSHSWCVSPPAQVQSEATGRHAEHICWTWYCAVSLLAQWTLWVGRWSGERQQEEKWPETSCKVNVVTPPKKQTKKSIEATYLSVTNHCWTSCIRAEDMRSGVANYWQPWLRMSTHARLALTMHL